MVSTIKISQMTDGGNLDLDKVVPGLDSGANRKFTVQLQFAETGDTAARPPSPADPTIRYNTDFQQFEYWNGLIWAQLGSSGDVAVLIARLAAHTVGDGASMIGLQNQGGVSNKTVQDMSEADFIVKTNVSSLLNGFALSTLSTGYLSVETATGNLVARTFTGAASQIDLTNPTGLAGNTQISFAANPLMTGTASLTIPLGTTAQRPGIPMEGMIRYNTDLNALEYYNATAVAWQQTGVVGGAVTSVSGTLNRITSTGGTTPVIDISASYVGQTSITTLGTIGTGTWQGTPVTVPFGGSGLSSATAYAVLCGGTTSTSPFQSIASVGTAGQVLTSNGAGALPTFQSLGGSGTVNAGLINQLGYYAANGTTISGLTTANNGVLVTSAGGVPSISSTLPSNLTIPSPRITTGIYDSNGNLMLGFTATGSAVNNFQMQNNIATGNPVLSAVGSDSNIGIQIDGKGTSGAYIKGQQTGLTPAGYRGEQISSAVLAGSGVAMTTTVPRNITSISLTAGNWLVLGVVSLASGTSNIIQAISWCSLTSATLPDNSIRSGQTSAATFQFNLPTAPLIVNTSSTVTCYLEGDAVFSSGSVTGSGYIVAIRI